MEVEKARIATHGHFPISRVLGMWAGTIPFESIVLALTENYLTPPRGSAAASQELVYGLSSVQRGGDFYDTGMLDVSSLS